MRGRVWWRWKYFKFDVRIMRPERPERSVLQTQTLYINEHIAVNHIAMGIKYLLLLQVGFTTFTIILLTEFLSSKL